MKKIDSISLQGISRRKILTYGAVLPLSAMIGKYAHAAEFNYKMATGQDPTHPVNKRAQEALTRIKEATGGRVDIRLFPANQLGSDTDLLAQVRNGGVEFFNLSASILATLVPASGIANMGFAFNGYDQVWKAMDGDLGKYIRSQIEKIGIITVSRSWDNGFRQVTSSTRAIRTPDDLRGFKMRVPPAPILTSLFQALGAGPTPINFNEVYSALQTKLVEGQENPLPIIATARLYEVQKYCSMTSHVWDGYWVLGNRRAVEKLPADLQAIVLREFDRAALDQRGDIAKLNDSLRQDMTSKGLQFVDVDKNAFRDALRKSSFYKDWKAKFGEQGWNLLQQEVGALA
ncbi:TRAP transporter substrate-binding protein [Herbaspirillum sp. RTI4]|uniref:TRAP transporter substrate-binding protein n=1 Tax=Herbaspirillum sp. RTI4 TaxID=3048640 RepID=UPI002AB39022|nr:TRAP transporter substrate-binding protein [Herbaspirillum sp. RTI4]MDY7579411.1 TRAP transporter substrate-binding protein [Herbaspirillum sp. RTI4]MEA9980325.1 TRAP transporter substrate-binding protein [Herbaspirillum sp. RTI4]